MKTTCIAIIPFTLAVSLYSCKSDDLTISESEKKTLSEIKCEIDGNNDFPTRSHFEYSPSEKCYYGRWDKNDKIAVLFDEDTDASTFTLVGDGNTASGSFIGYVPDNYQTITALYPENVYVGGDGNSFNIELPDTISFPRNGYLQNAMPMFARGTNGTLRFYNLMSAIRLTLKGEGLLRSITIHSQNNQSLSGKGTITVKQGELPTLELEKTGKPITIDVGGILLNEESSDIALPIPAGVYDSGLSLSFKFEGHEISHTLTGPLSFEAAVIRPVKQYTFECPFAINDYQPASNEVIYFSESKSEIANTDVFQTEISSHSYSSRLGAGMIVTQHPIESISGELFKSPSEITGIKLPDSIKEIGDYAFKKCAFNRISLPTSLLTTGTGAFNGCQQLEEVIFPEGFKSIGADCFAECPNISKVYLPESIEMITHYSFRKSTARLDHWDGECQLIDKDRHTLYGNAGYGLINDQLTNIDVVAGCNLTEYTIPEQVQSLQNYALSGCVRLEKLIIPAGLRSLAYEPFPKSNSLRTIICHPSTPPGLDIPEKIGIANITEILVPYEAVDLYRQADGWNTLADKIKPM